MIPELSEQTKTDFTRSAPYKEDLTEKDQCKQDLIVHLTIISVVTPEMTDQEKNTAVYMGKLAKAIAEPCNFIPLYSSERYKNKWCLCAPK